jgi:uncharacterized protein
MRTYVLTEDQFRSLARGEGDPDAIALLIDSQLSRRRLFLVAAAGTAEPGSELSAVLRLIARIDRADPGAGRDLLRYPFLGAWFGTGTPDAGGLGALAAAVAVGAGVPFDVEMTLAGDDLVLPGLGSAAGVGPGRVRLRGDGTGLTIIGRRTLQVPGDGWRSVQHLRVAGSAVEIADTDPLRNRFPEPPLPPLTTTGADTFGRLIGDAWAILDEEQPGHAAALRSALRSLVPLRTPANGALVSASVRGCFGAIGMSLPDNATTAAELLVHEFQHEKLGALLDMADLCTGTGPARYHAPWRPDPRPAAALMQGVYAFAGVAAFWRERRLHLTGRARRRAEFRYASWREQVTYAVEQLLGSGELTPTGLSFFSTLQETVESWPSDSPAAGAARLSAAAGHIAWRLAHQVPNTGDTEKIAAAWVRGDSIAPTATAPAITPDGRAAMDLAAIIEGTWLDDGEPVPSTEAERAVAGGDHQRALDLCPRPAGDREWITLATALHVTGHDIAHSRPDLLRAVAERTADEAGDIRALAGFLSG